MKLVKNLVFASLLVFATTFNTFAGEQNTPTGPSPEPPAPKQVTTTIEEGTNPIDPYTGEITAETTDYLFFEALAALLSVY
ncbi:MAG TPA: hypothetical protein VFS76_22170 [Pyrinomonadaceae bacterium]|nr:hypothetical protein [Pyrinomonadaceae bacterium]